MALAQLPDTNSMSLRGAKSRVDCSVRLSCVRIACSVWSCDNYIYHAASEPINAIKKLRAAWHSIPIPGYTNKDGSHEHWGVTEEAILCSECYAKRDKLVVDSGDSSRLFFSENWEHRVDMTLVIRTKADSMGTASHDTFCFLHDLVDYLNKQIGPSGASVQVDYTSRDLVKVP